MTDKFDDLMYHAGLTAQGCWDQMDDYDRTAILKFGELIIQECASFADKHNQQKLYEDYTLGVGKAIKKHFGVEE